jgi:phospholipid/cholesterol/gamma-HCH transport system substrate-binding protein
MSSAENKRSAIVGIFIFLGILIFIIAVFTLAGKQKRFVKSITLKAIFDDVSGLQTGNNIWFSGVKIGTVKKMNFYGNSQVEITMNIEEDAQKYIRKDAKAKISSEGFIGNKNIVVYGGTTKVSSVEDGDVLQVEKAIGTDEIMATLQENNKNLLTITNDFKLLSHKIKNGEGTLGAILTDSLMANNFRSVVSNIQTASSSLSMASSSISRFTTKLNNSGGLVNQMLTDTAVFNSLKTSVAQLQQTTNSVSALTQKVNQQLNTNNNAVGLLLNDETTASTLKNTLENLETSTKKLDQNMEALQHNFLLRGYFRKQARKEAELRENQQDEEK